MVWSVTRLFIDTVILCWVLRKYAFPEKTAPEADGPSPCQRHLSSSMIMIKLPRNFWELGNRKLHGKPRAHYFSQNMRFFSYFRPDGRQTTVRNPEFYLERQNGPGEFFWSRLINCQVIDIVLIEQRISEEDLYRYTRHRWL